MGFLDKLKNGINPDAESVAGLDTILVVNGVITEQVGFSTFSDAFTFALLIVILVFKPTGLFGEKLKEKI